MKRIILSVLFSGLFFSNLQAQLFSANAKDASKIKDRTLIVVLQEESPVILSRYKSKPEKLEQYKKIISLTNDYFMSAFKNYWDLSLKVEFKKAAELPKSADSSYVLFTYKLDERVMEVKPSLQGYALRKEMLKRKLFGKLEFTLSEKLKKESHFLIFFTPTSFPYQSDIISTVSQVRNFLKLKMVDPGFNTKAYEEMIAPKNESIPDKILLVDSAQCEKVLGNYDYIKEEYPYPFKLTDQKEIERVIAEKDNVYVYVIIFPHYDLINRGGSFEGTTGGGMDTFTEEVYFSHLVIDPSTLEIVGYGKNIDPVVNRRSWKQYYKFIDSNNFNIKSLSK
ncbi:MAG: hypothetical protein K2X86_16705 [Cytophagaceae bacterium]|nr:hypothetical protein [Cytophagaceae bacterium]